MKKETPNFPLHSSSLGLHHHYAVYKLFWSIDLFKWILSITLSTLRSKLGKGVACLTLSMVVRHFITLISVHIFLPITFSIKMIL